MSERIRQYGCLLLILGLAGCVSAPPRQSAALLRGERLLSAGVTAYRDDDYVMAADSFTKAVTYYQGLDDHPGTVRSRINLVETALAVGNYAAAYGQLAAARRLADRDDMTAAKQRLRLLQSSLDIRRGRYAAARQELQPLLRVKVKGVASDNPVVLDALANRIEIALHSQDDDPQPWLRRYAAAVRDNRDPRMKARLLCYRAAIVSRQGNTASAQRALEQALAIYKAIPARRGIAATLEQSGELSLQQQQWESAAERFQRALDIRIWLLDRAHTVTDLERLAQAVGASGATQRSAVLRHWAARVGSDSLINWSKLEQATLH